MPSTTLESSVREHLCNGYMEGKFPLFVIGSGVSHGRVPFLKDMVSWLQAELKREHKAELKREHKGAIPKKGGKQSLAEVLLKQAASLMSGRASRFDAAKFFSAFQFAGAERAINNIWNDFTKGLVVEGLKIPGGKQSVGLLRFNQSHCSPAHHILTRLLVSRLCHLVNLNYDPLLQLATGTSPKSGRFISLYTPEDIKRYYSAPIHIVNGGLGGHFPHQAAAVHVRGDIFFATCENKQCPQHGKSRTIDPTRYHDESDIFICPSCHQQSSRLQLSFPGYETKEKMVSKLFATLIRFIGLQISSIICVGVSGQWDQYLLDEIFSRANEFQIPILDVRPPDKEPNYFDLFRLRFYPSISIAYKTREPSYLRLYSLADDFMGHFESSINTIRSPVTEMMLARETIAAEPFALK